MVATGIARGAHAEFARGITSQEISFQHPVLHDIPRMRSHAFIIERTAGKSLEHVRPIVDLHFRSEYRFAETVQQERGFSVQAAAADRSHKMTQQPGSDRRLE